MDKEKTPITPGIKLLRSFARVNKTMTKFVQQTAIANGLSVPQYTVLLTVASEKKITQKTVGERTFLPKSTLSQAVEVLVQEGLLKRQQVEDNRREMQLILSDKGLTLLKAIHQQEGGVHQLSENAVGLLTDQQFEELLETHRTIASYFETQNEQGES